MVSVSRDELFPQTTDFYNCIKPQNSPLLRLKFNSKLKRKEQKSEMKFLNIFFIAMVFVAGEFF